MKKSCKDELWGSPQRLLGAATPAGKKTRQDPVAVEGPSSAPSTMMFRAHKYTDAVKLLSCMRC